MHHIAQHIKRDIRRVSEDFFSRDRRTSDVVTEPGFRPQFDGRSEWTHDLLDSSGVHDTDFVVFGFFRNRNQVILDIGAHFGYSAASIWAAGSTCSVVSFEPNEGYSICLESIYRLRPDTYDYHMVGLADRSGVAEFATVVVNGHGLGALATMQRAPDVDRLVGNVAEYCQHYLQAESKLEFKIHPFIAPIAKLDDIWLQTRCGQEGNNVVAMKIDTEGAEASVVIGALALIVKHKPLILAEGGSSNEELLETLLAHKYLLGQRYDRKLKITNNPVVSNNIFFLHVERIAEYKSLGLLID